MKFKHSLYDRWKYYPQPPQGDAFQLEKPNDSNTPCIWETKVLSPTGDAFQLEEPNDSNTPCMGDEGTIIYRGVWISTGTAHWFVFHHCHLNILVIWYTHRFHKSELDAAISTQHILYCLTYSVIQRQIKSTNDKFKVWKYKASFILIL